MSVVFAIIFAANTQASDTFKVEYLIGQWCLYGMAMQMEGEKIPDDAIYEFTKEGILNYESGPFKQSGNFSINGDVISTDDMGNYKIISIKRNEMILNYAGFMFFRKGKCK